MPTRKLLVAAAAVSGVVLAAGCSSSSSGGSSGGSTASAANASTATSVAAFGGMNGLVAACKKEGTLNVITLPANWANYGAIMKDFTAKYGIKINDANPDGSSQDEINAMQQLKGQSRAPDVLDMGTSFAIKADQLGLIAPYKVATWASIPANSKASDASWYDDYGGYVAIGYDSAKVKVPPTSFADLLKPTYKNQVAINGNPTQASAAFSAVYASALANGGSLSNIEPGIQYFKKLHQAGNFVPVTAGPTTVQSGQTPIVIWWDYLLASEISSAVPTFKIVIPSDGHYAAYYSQAVSKTAPNPACARLWEEYLYSVTGQNLWLQGKARPIELPTLVSNGTVDKAANAALPAAPGFSLYGLGGVALVYMYFQIPLMVLIILPAFEGLRPAWREAAENLGAGTWQYWRRIAGPVLMPSFLGCLLLLFGSAFSAYATAEALTSGTIPLTAIQIGSFLNGNVLAGQQNVGKALGLGMVVIIAVLMVFYALLQRRAARWLR